MIIPFKQILKAILFLEKFTQKFVQYSIIRSESRVGWQ